MVDESRYFGGSLVEKQGLREPRPVTEVIPEIRGQIVLVGESGLGKTMFLRHLVNAGP